MKPFSTALIAVLLLALDGCGRGHDSKAYTVKNVGVNLGSIMYMDEEEGMYDVWYDGVELQSGNSKVFVALDGHSSGNKAFDKLQPGDHLEILTNLSSVKKMELDAYWADDIEIRTID